MQDIIIHTLNNYDSSWRIELKPQYIRRIYGYGSIIESLVIDRRSNYTNIKNEAGERYEAVINDYTLEQALDFASYQESIEPYISCRLVAAIPGGFRYRFFNHEMHMSFYVKKCRNIFVFKYGERDVLTVITDSMYFPDFSVLKGALGITASSTKNVTIAEFTAAPGKRREAIKELSTYTEGAKTVTIIDPYILGKITSKCEVNAHLIQKVKRRIDNLHIVKKLEEINGRDFGSVDKLIAYIERSISPKYKELAILTKIAEELFIRNCYVSDLKKAISNNDADKLTIIYSKSHAYNISVRNDIVTMFKGKVIFYDLDEHDDISIHDRVWIVDSSRAVLVGNSFGGLGLNALSFILPLPNHDLEALKSLFVKTGIKI